MRNSFIDFLSTVVSDVYEKIFLFEYRMVNQILQLDVHEKKNI